MSRWWRAYDEALHDPKLIALSDRLHRAWFNLLCVASKNGGTLPAIATVAIELRVTVIRAAEYITALVTAGLVDEIQPGKFAPHNWPSRQFQSDVSTERVKRFRNAKRNVSSTVSETPPETETETETETDSEVRTSAAGAAPEPDLIDVVDEEPKARLFRLGKPLLISFGISEKRTGALIGQWLKAKPDPLGLLAVLQFARDQNVAEPVAYVSAIIHGKQKNGAVNEFDRRPGESLDGLASRMAAEAREFERTAGAQRPDDDFGRH